MNPRVLGVVLRELSRIGRDRGGRDNRDWEQVRPLITKLAEQAQSEGTRLHAWFRDGLTSGDYVRYRTLVKRLPNRLTADERKELLDLTLRGLRVTESPSPDADARIIEPAGTGFDPGRRAGADAPAMVVPGDGEVTGFGMVSKVRGEWSGGALAILETTLDPGRLVPPHTHAHEDETTYVISGAVTFEVGDRIVQAAAGAYVVKPRGVSHAFWNSGAEPARLMEIHAPGRLGPYYDAIRDLGDMAGADRQAAMAGLQQRYGITPHPERIEELSARHGVSV